MTKEDKKRILATNRLLEILREQRSSKDVKKAEDETVDSELAKESKEEELQEVSKSKTGKLAKKVESKDVKKAEDETVGSDRDSLRPNIFARIKSTEKPAQEPGTTDITSDIDTSKSEKSQSSRSLEDIKDNLLLKTSIIKDIEESGNGGPVLPPKFNESLITFYKETPKKSKWNTFSGYLKRYLANSRRKITLSIDNDSIFLLQTYLIANKTEVEKVKSYSLPYDYEDQSITEINELLAHVLENDIALKDKKRSFGAYFSMSTPSKTTIIKSPKLKKKELNELIQWHAEKDLTFSPENKNVNWEINKTGRKEETNDVIIGVTDNIFVNTIDSIFNNSGINLRLTSTLPVLLWKSFVKNYPERNVGSYVIIHMGESRTVVIVVTDQILQFSRQIALGAQDLYKAITKNIEKDESGQAIDITFARDLLIKFGYPLNISSGLAANYNIDLNKVTVALRPIVERTVSELNRTLNFFKNQKPDLKWKKLLFDGIGSSFPGLLESIQENIYQNVELLNPMRTGEYHIHDDVDIPHQQYPNYVLNFILAADEVEDFNVAPMRIREDYKYSFYSNIVAILTAVLVPLFLVTSLYNNVIIKRGHSNVQSKKTELQHLATNTKDYESFVGDIKFINSSDRVLKNDRQYSDNQIRMLKLFSSVVPEEIKLTSLNFVNATGLPDSVVSSPDFNEHIKITGFVDNYKSVADIYLADFILRLGKMRQFSNVITVEKSNRVYLGRDKLFFTLRLNLR